jgi:hypothetical protein
MVSSTSPYRKKVCADAFEPNKKATNTIGKKVNFIRIVVRFVLFAGGKDIKNFYFKQRL